ncbi:MAG: RluA family pseudouridine synthase [Anaeroplasma sp.]|uniref:RluA family pseudouridine synthase n=1 Tax=Anaeroplasma sp. TaxID=1872523 RepID=UPI002A91E589|nr:RluA family pseudouridine synthase [Anaeroplasma sp.]MDY5983817.1 RluA family pseudouridine synthase [Anaeroplasma sp.]
MRNKVTKERPEKIEYTASFKVNRSDELLEFLLKKMNTSRNNVKNLLSHHMVLVNGSPVSQYNLMLAKDDEVKITKKPQLDMPRVKNNSKNKKDKPKRVYLDILYEDDDFIAINKPNGLLSVESDKERECAFSYVLEYMQENDPKSRPFVLHRIDKETSGVLVFAKNVKIHSMLKLNWNEYIKTREYFAMVEGTLKEKEGRITSYLKENQNNLVYSTQDPSGLLAVTDYKVKKENGQYSLLSVLIFTGRKNQIRVHMHDIGNPIVGDDKYGCTKNPLKRLGLHASRLEFLHPITKELISIKAPVPNIFYGPFEKER